MTSAPTTPVTRTTLIQSVLNWFETNHHMKDEVTYWTKAEWNAKGEEYGNDADLTLVIEGSPLYVCLNFPDSKWDFQVYDDFYQNCGKSAGYYPELGYGWSVHFYPIERKAAPQPDVKPIPISWRNV